MKEFIKPKSIAETRIEELLRSGEIHRTSSKELEKIQKQMEAESRSKETST